MRRIPGVPAQDVVEGNGGIPEQDVLPDQEPESQPRHQSSSAELDESEGSQDEKPKTGPGSRGPYKKKLP